MCAFSTSERPKWSEHEHVVFYYFDLKMCFAPQRRVLFSTSQLPKMVRTRQIFTFLSWTCALRHSGVRFFNISTSKSGLKLRCFVHFDLEMCFAPQRRAIFISHLASWLRTRCFSEPTFRPQSRKSLEKHSESRLSYLFVHLRLLSSQSSSSLIFSLLFFSSLTLPTSAFPSVHIVGSLTSKLPSNIGIHSILQ